MISWTFPFQEMPSEVRAVQDANWAGKRCARRRVGGSTSVVICWRRTRRHSRLWRCQLVRGEYNSITKGAAHALEVRSAVMECGRTLKVGVGHGPVGWTGKWPRDMASAACVTWMRGCCGCSTCVQQEVVVGMPEPGLESTTRQTWEQRWSTLRRTTSLLKGNTPSATNGLELMDGGDDDSPRLHRQQKIAVS